MNDMKRESEALQRTERNGREKTVEIERDGEGRGGGWTGKSEERIERHRVLYKEPTQNVSTI